jgi:hypothetical protein
LLRWNRCRLDIVLEKQVPVGHLLVWRWDECCFFCYGLSRHINIHFITVLIPDEILIGKDRLRGSRNAAGGSLMRVWLRRLRPRRWRDSVFFIIVTILLKINDESESQIYSRAIIAMEGRR